VFIWHTIRVNNEITTANLFFILDQGNWKEMREEVIATGPETNPGKAATFQIAWILLWEEGIRPLTKKPMEAMQALESARRTYTNLAGLVENDPVLASEANYALALIDETLLVTEPTSAARAEGLTKVVRAYRDVEQKYGDTAHGKQAKARADHLETKRADVLAFYDQFATRNPGLAIFRQLQLKGGGNLGGFGPDEAP
jgi:hypothetical protein